jgi:site-specific DNA recombinase
VNDKDLWIWGEQRHDPIIDIETFDRCAAKLASRSGGKGASGRGRNQYLLSGLVRCGHCGSAMIGRNYQVRPAGGKVYGYRLYLCGGYHQYGRLVCRRHPVDAAALEGAVLAKLEGLTRDFLEPANLAQLRAEIARQDAAEGGQSPADMRRLKARLDDLERKTAEAADRVLDEKDPHLLRALRARLKGRLQERDAVAAELQAAERRAAESPDPLGGVDEAVAMMQGLAGRLRAEDALEVQACLQEWLADVELWFRSVPQPKRETTAFARGLIHLREDLRLSYHSVQTGLPKAAAKSKPTQPGPRLPGSERGPCSPTRPG